MEKMFSTKARAVGMYFLLYCIFTIPCAIMVEYDEMTAGFLGLGAIIVPFIICIYFYRFSKKTEDARYFTFVNQTKKISHLMKSSNIAD
jgi:hypothetical protein